MQIQRLAKKTNLSHREFVYRQAFEVGRHVIGYEVQKVLAAVDYFDEANQQGADLPIAVAGVSEGGLLALYSGALDTRIDATLVSGYFDQRERLWQEPIDRNVWSLLTEFGDAELANLIAPRSLWIEATPQIPEVIEPVKVNRQVAAPGSIRRLNRDSVEHEIERAKRIWQSGATDRSVDWLTLIPSGTDTTALPGKVVAQWIESITGRAAQFSDRPRALAVNPPSSLIDRRQQRQVGELVDFTQHLLRQSHRTRDRRFAAIDRSSIDRWEDSINSVRQQVYEDLIGRLPTPTIPANPRTRMIMEEPEFTGYEVVLDVYPGVIASGVLLLPTNLQPNDKRPVVVCQHGLEGTPMSTIGGPDSKDYHYYKAMSVELTKRGFIVYAPQNPYRGQDKFRTLQRKSNPLGRSLFSYIIPQHLVTLRWLASLPNVDRDRIGFYGLSYGGKTAMRVPPFLVPSETEPGYCLSICSADFNEWVSKNASVDAPFSYLWTGEYEIFEWNMAHVANYAELAMLIVTAAIHGRART